jgi:hypothetical protein
MLEITVNIPGLEGLVAALQGLAVKQGDAIFDLHQQFGEAVQLQQPYNAPPIQQMAPPPTYQAPQQMTPPVTVPVAQPDPMGPPTVYVQMDQPNQQPVQAPPVGVPTTDVNYTNEQLAVAMTSLVDAGKMDAVRALLNRFNAPSLMQLPKEMYGAFANELRQMGAKL